MVKLHHLMNIEDPERVERRNFPNGDVFVGTIKEVLPHGTGKYLWSDGTLYEGDWEEGKMTGKGIICWPSGASYDGDFSGGYLHGFGTFIAPNGSKYRGAWRMNIQHGIGRKQYLNSDIYEGSWKEGVREGSGSYIWNTRNAYVGSWKGGKMNGRGVMKWANGDVYDGFWLNGLRHGSGVYRFVDGAYYSGSWSRNLKDGKGTFYPVGTKHPSLRRWRNTLGSDDSGGSFLFHGSSLSSDDGAVLGPNVARTLSENGSINRMLGHSGRQRLDETWDLFDSARELLYRETSSMNNASDGDPKELQDSSTVVYEREYMQGVLIKEKTRNVKTSRKTKQKNRFDLEQPKRMPCVDIFYGHRSYHLMLSLQLGIRYTVGKITPVPRREVRASDFGEQARIRMYFPRKGSQFTPPHCSVDFYWKDYCPMVFRNLREMFKLDAAEYMMSICGDDGLREISSPGKSGSIFYLSHDGRFVIKTLKKHELKALLRMLHDYYRYVGKYENTLITKFFGVHRITLRGGRKVRFVVMGNMFCTELRIHRRYDLKGSTHGRSTNMDKIRESTTLKDLDLAYEFHMDKMLRDSLFKQLSLDCSFLETQQIIDYSLLLGLHFRAPEHLKAILEPPAAMPNHDISPATGGVTSQGELLIPPKGLLLVTHEPNSVSTAPGPHIRGNTLRAYSVGEKEVDLLLPGTGRLRVQLGVNMPAQANHKLMQDDVDAAEVELFEVYDVVLYMGIIDILQEYNIKKKVERALKSLKFDPITISVAEPRLYAKRFLEFLGTVFPEQP